MTDETADRFAVAHDHLDAADALFSELASDLEAQFIDAIDETPVDVEYDLDARRVSASLPLDALIDRFNQHLDAPLYAKHDGSTVHVIDVRDEYQFNIDDAEALSSMQAVDVVDHLETEAHGAPEGKVRHIIRYLGDDDPEGTIESLRRQGDIYKSGTGFLRSVR
jgi:hypothetical protein